MLSVLFSGCLWVFVVLYLLDQLAILVRGRGEGEGRVVSNILSHPSVCLFCSVDSSFVVVFSIPVYHLNL